jgi:protein involved in polysaccharide export with SLBB domain
MCIPFGALFGRGARNAAASSEAAGGAQPTAGAEDVVHRRGGGSSLDEHVTAKDLAPTSAAREEGGDATQGDFLMAAKARRGQAARGSLELTSGDTTSAPQTPARPGNVLGDIDVPQARWDQ